MKKFKTKRRPLAASTKPSAGPRRPNPPRQAFAKGDVLKLPRGQRAVVGIHSVLEAVKVRPQAILRILLRDNWSDSKALVEIREQALQRKISVETAPSGHLDRVATSHQGICAILNESPQWDTQILLEPGPAMVLLLDGIEDPHNLGAILRTGWLMGAKGLFLPQDRAAPLTPSAMKVASGGAEHVPVEIVANLTQVIEELKKHEFWVFGLAEKGRQTIWQLALPDKIAWVIGAEDKGLRSTTANACDELVHIPQATSGSSYNASVAAAIVMAEGARQHGLRVPSANA